jgi:hypothetical protein
MTTRLQVLLEDDEYRRFRQLARKRGMSMAEWVRQALRLAYRQEPLGDREKKLAAVRAASRHNFPTADIEEMLREIEQGYAGGGA